MYEERERITLSPFFLVGPQGRSSHSCEPQKVEEKTEIGDL